MKELLYKKSEAVAALNRVDGFHPMELARKIGEEGQEEQLYLDVKYRKLWFRLVNPAGKIISRIITFTENMAVVEARIYLDKCDQEDNYVANSFSQKFRSDDPKFGDKFLEMAETAAVGRALSDAGYGVQFADVGEENDPAQVDAGIPYQNPQMPDSGAMENAAMPDSGVMPNAPMPTYGEMPGQPEYAGQQMMNQFYQQAQAAGSTIYHGSGQMPGYGSAPAASTPPKTGQMLQGALQNLDTSLPVEELMKHMNYEMAVGTVIPGKGKYGGKTMDRDRWQLKARQRSSGLPSNIRFQQSGSGGSKGNFTKSNADGWLRKNPAESFFLRGKGGKRPGCIMICLGLIMEYWMWCRCCISESGGETIMTARFVERRMEN